VRQRPTLRESGAALRQRTLRLVHGVDGGAVDLVEGVVPRVQHRRHQRSDERRDEKRRRPRRARRRAHRGQRARHETQRRRDQRKRAREIDEIADWGLRIAECGRHAMMRAAIAATPVLMKLSMSLFRIPGPSTVAPRMLSTSAPAVAATTTTKSAEPGISPSAMAMAARPNAASTPAAVPSSDIAPGVPGFTRPNVVTRKVERPHALPISLATVSLPPAVRAATSARSAGAACG